MSNDREILQSTLDEAQRALSILEVQAATYSSADIPSHKQIELENKRKQVEELKEKLNQLPPHALTKLSYEHTQNLMRLLEKAEEEKDWDGIISLGEEILRFHPSHGIALRKTGLAYGQRATEFLLEDDYIRAIVNFNDAIEKTPGKTEYYSQRGICWQKLENYEKAFIDFVRFIKLEPKQQHKIVPPLIDIIKNNDNNMQSKAAELLMEIGGPAVEPLICALEDKNNNTRHEIVKIIGDIKDQTAVKPLIKVLKDQDTDVRRNAAEALGKIGDKIAVEPLIEALKDKISTVRYSAINSLSMLGDEQVVEPLIGMLKDQDSDVRYSAINSLNTLGDKQAVEPLIGMLKDQDIQVRCEAIYALGNLGDTRAVSPLVLILSDKSSEGCVAAVKALVTMGEPAVESLILALSDKFWQVRYYAAEILGKIGDTRAVEPLFLAINDQDSDVGSKATEALGKIGNGKRMSR